MKREREREMCKLLEGTKIPDTEAAVVAARREQEVLEAVPADDVDVLCVRVLADAHNVAHGRDGARAAGHARVPDADAAVAAARRKDRRLRRRPLQVLHARTVADKRALRRHHRLSAHRRPLAPVPQVDRTRAVARQQACRPVVVWLLGCVCETKTKQK